MQHEALYEARCLSSFATDAASELDVLGHDGDTLGVDSAQVGVFEETNEVSLGGLLKCHHSRGLEAQIGLEVLSDLTDQALERQLADEKLGALLVATDLTQGDGAGPVSVGLLDTSGGGGRFAGSLGGELLARGLASGGLTSGLLGTSHDDDGEVAALRAGSVEQCPLSPICRLFILGRPAGMHLSWGSLVGTRVQ